MKLSDIKKFERLNDLAINLYCVVKRKVLPFLLSENVNAQTINLLVLSSTLPSANNSSEKFYHFAWIKDLSALLSSQLSKRGHKKFFCNVCLNHFSSDALLRKHATHCHKINKCSVRLPDDAGKYLEFSHHLYKEKVPFAIYADLESILAKCDDTFDNANATLYQQRHLPFSIALYLKCSYDDSQSKFLAYRGADCITWFVNQLRDIAFRCNSIFDDIVPMETLSPAQIQSFDSATHCHICEKPFLENEIKVRDHSHLGKGEYRGPAHRGCNLNFQDSHAIPVVFHNLSGYDSHFLIRELATGIPDKLSSYLGNEMKTITRSHSNNDVEFNLLTKKGVFPYEYVDSWERLSETELPHKDAFFSQLRNEGVSDDEYAHALTVWNTFSIDNLGQYADLYLKTDVLLLADIFENFRSTCIRTYELDPLHYFTAPGLAFDAMLKMTQIRLELMTDIDQIMFIEAGIRGGVTQCSTRYAKANNKYMGERYDPNVAPSYLMYFDINSLYGVTMCEPLPYGDFSFVEDFENLDILNHPDDADIGYIVECDLDYPEELHRLHSDLPLGPEHMVPSGSKLKKLLLTLYPKRNYIVHYRNLKLYLKHGLRLAKIHRVLRFKQSSWLKKYIDLNTLMRQQSRNVFDKNFYKLMINSVFGKLMENVRKYRDVRLVTRWEGRHGARELISKPNFHSCTIFDKDMVIIEMNRLEVFLNKPIYAGFAVLDVSKTFLYDFHYDYVLPKFGTDAKLLYTDTDSLIYNFTVPDIYQSVKEDIHRFDTADYARDNVFGIPLVNKKVPGLMKDENNGAIMLEFVGLRAKMYAYRVRSDDDDDHDKIVKKSKGSTAASIKKITVEDYKNSLFNETIVKSHQHLIKSKDHSVFTIKQHKVVLSPHDDKRMISLNHIDTRPWGYISPQALSPYSTAL
ncbi:hypothetical protein RI129_005875 [Pyrocoelia pectoralis]|uniref:DNA-directed DNA polymerase n=1 Tax=Pyrocoelia pectoralis TaxID=417401 RepID=A0AAN7V9Q5_9COLE